MDRRDRATRQPAAQQHIVGRGHVEQRVAAGPEPPLRLGLDGYHLADKARLDQFPHARLLPIRDCRCRAACTAMHVLRVIAVIDRCPLPSCLDLRRLKPLPFTRALNSFSLWFEGLYLTEPESRGSDRIYRRGSRLGALSA